MWVRRLSCRIHCYTNDGGTTGFDACLTSPLKVCLGALHSKVWRATSDTSFTVVQHPKLYARRGWTCRSSGITEAIQISDRFVSLHFTVQGWVQHDGSYFRPPTVPHPTSAGFRLIYTFFTAGTRWNRRPRQAPPLLRPQFYKKTGSKLKSLDRRPGTLPQSTAKGRPPAGGLFGKLQNRHYTQASPWDPERSRIYATAWGYTLHNAGILRSTAE